MRRIRSCAELVYVHSTAVAKSKAEDLATGAEGLYEYAQIEGRDVRLGFHGGVAVVNGAGDMTAGALGEPKHPVRLLFVMVWVKHQDIWRLELRLAAMPSTGKMGSGHTQTNYPIGSDE